MSGLANWRVRTILQHRPFVTITMNFLILGNIAEIAAETGKTFGFNINLFISQIISFSVVCILLNKFAYKPLLGVLAERRQRIEESLANAEKVKQQLADAETRYQEILSNANAEAQKLIDEARKSSGLLAERKQQEAISQAEQIISKAKEATALERERVLNELKAEIGHLVVSTTSKVTGKVLNEEDHRKINEEAAANIKL